MAVRVMSVVVLMASASLSSMQSAIAEPLSDYHYQKVEQQALQLGPILGAIEACQGRDDSGKLFHEFMQVKRGQELDGAQAAMIAALLGATTTLEAGKTQDCTAQAMAERRDVITVLRDSW